ncbi:pyridoxal phosphate-dependent aminotransferase [Rhodohalobacter barkolensis]|uniref:GDP-perosamine synthase n=2 Tax=Rhodohalobacter barkolensis TaxID=2053187 RepID=A0A2N0VGB4_9BACT|nr:pyridoxal phosphate-dependent aminotransferase [Rhodohalobacter barkolensis]
MGGQEIDFVNEAFETNWIAPLGKNVNGFEEDLQKYTGRKHAAVVTTGTAAIHLGLILCGVKPGDEVICQSFTFAATANPIKYQEAQPVFIDSEPETWNMDPVLLEKALRERRDKIKAIVVVHLYGMPAKMESILSIAEKYGVPVIEDSAEALGSSIDGRKCGTFGKISVLSFNGNKIITTSGGGALLSDDEEIVQKARFLSTQARDDAPHYQHSELGYNYRMSNIVAGIGRGQMKVLDERVAARRANHQFYFENLKGAWYKGNGKDFSDNDEMKSGSGIYFLQEPDGYKSNRWLTTILVNPDETDGITREHLRQALEKQNIESRPLWKPMHLQPLYGKSPVYKNGVSEFLFEYGLCLPSGSNLSDEERWRVLNAIKEVLGNS